MNNENQIKHIVFDLFGVLLTINSDNQIILLEEGISLLKQCLHYGYNIFLLSNCSSSTMATLKQKHPDIFNIFQGIVIPRDVGYKKPNIKIFEHLLEKFNLEAQECYFIDDSIENILSAELLGMHAILYTNPEATLKTLNDKNIL
ncbi:MAG: HAD-IA family hydrolase [Candidatus Babeliales bacterium]